jgi:hypothetical protein
VGVDRGTLARIELVVEARGRCLSSLLAVHSIQVVRRTRPVPEA